jgi:hypothetical protein
LSRDLRLGDGIISLTIDPSRTLRAANGTHGGRSKTVGAATSWSNRSRAIFMSAMVCKSRNELIVEYALRETAKPMGVSQYRSRPHCPTGED